MTLHIYNPEHDIALAKNSEFFTPPKAARLTRERFCHIPALWAEDGDWVLVDDVAQAQRNLVAEKRRVAKVSFVTYRDLSLLKTSDLPERIDAWGWDKYLVHRLLKANSLFAGLLPNSQRLENIRTLSSREFASTQILPRLVGSDLCFVGEAEVVRGTAEDVAAKVAEHQGVVLKSPWSCSGRGVRFVTSELSEHDLGWVRNILNEQGCIMMEPIYNKVLDFAMEFYASDEGVKYRSLNVFETKDGKYLGNIEGSQEKKLHLLTQYIQEEVISTLRENIIDITTKAFNKKYVGHFGIDAMIVLTPENEMKVHPCVEMNLRRTMGQL